MIYVHDLATGRRHVAANFKGSNSAPAWSPDGLQLAVVLTKDGGSQIFLVGADGSGLRRLATSASIDTEPRFSPDGGSIYFSSDRGGFAPNGRMIVYATEVNGKGVLAAVSVDGRVKQRLSSALAADVREPAWAPFNR